MPLQRIAAYVALLASVVALLAFGVVGFGRGDNVAFADVRYFFVAAKMVAAGSSPYVFEAFKSATVSAGLGNDIGVFPYPPHSLALWMPLAWLPIEAARWAWTALNLLIVAGVALAMGHWYAERSAMLDGSDNSNAKLWIAAIIIGNPFTAHLVWTGQTGLLVLVCLLLAWQGLKQERWVWAGVFLALASVKPQLSILVIAWVALMGQFRVLAIACATAVALLSVPLLAVGPEAITDWWQSAIAYQSLATGALAYNTNLRSLLMGIGLPLPLGMAWLLPLAALAFVATMNYRDRQQPLNRDDVLAVLLTASLFLVYGRDYDIAVLAPLVPALWWHSRGSTAAKVAGLVALVILFIPQRLVAQAGLPLLTYSRIALLGLLCAWLTAAVWRAPDRRATARHGSGQSA